MAIPNGTLSGNQEWDYLTKGENMAGGTEHATTFAGSRQEAATAPGVSYFRNRTYDQTSGRWLQEDPIGIAGGLNLYQYNGNDPVSFTDPFGLKPDTLDVAPGAEGIAADCDKNDVCKAHLKGLRNNTEYWRLEKGKTGSCAPYRAGCTSHEPVQGHGRGGTIKVIPSEFNDASAQTGRKVNSRIVLTHEMGHAYTDRLLPCLYLGEVCASAFEDAARAAEP